MQDKDLIASLAAMRAGGVVSLQLAWAAALRLLPPALSADRMRQMAEATPSPDALRRLARTLCRSRDPLTEWAAFIKEADESDANLLEWMESLDCLLLYAESKGLRPALPQAAGYLNCCTEARRAQGGKTPLPRLAQAMLEAYGLLPANG